MRPHLLDRVTAVWITLIAATFVTWWLGADHPLASDSGRVAAAIALGIAFLKARLIGRHFMGVRSSPRTLRVLFDVWVVAFASATIVLVLI